MIERKHALALAVSALLALPAAAKTTDVVVLMDESGSMAGEQAWMQLAIPLLDTGLNAASVTANRFGLVGFGASAAPAPGRTRSFAVGGGQLGTAAQYVTASAGLSTSGSLEDGWAAIGMANGYGFRSDAVRNFILVSDEDRDSAVTTLNFADTLGSLQKSKTLLNAVVNAQFKCGDGSRALGLIGTTGYKADGSGGFSTCAGAAFSGTDFGSTFEHYVQMALATGGGAWDLNLLRAGGLSAESFTAAFIDGKVAETIVTSPVPEPSTYALMILGLAGVGGMVRRRQQAR